MFTLLVWWSLTLSVTMSDDAVPPDVQAARKARFNSDIIKLCSIPHVAHLRPIAQGIGLYTHVAGPKTAILNPHFDFVDNTDREVSLLPLGGPRRIQPHQSRDAPNSELRALYKEVEDAVKAEEKIWSDQRAAAVERGESERDAYRMTLDTLKRKYGDVVAPSPAFAQLQQHYGNRVPRRHSGATDITSGGPLSENEGSSATNSELRRKSTGNVAMPASNTNVIRRGSGSVNIYNMDRDPRLRGRGGTSLWRG